MQVVNTLEPGVFMLVVQFMQQPTCLPVRTKEAGIGAPNTKTLVKRHSQQSRGDMGMGQNLVPLVNIKIAGKWMFIPLKMYL